MNPKEINDRLLRIYGKFFDGLPLYRLVWSDSQTESRFGEFDEYFGKIFLRHFVGIKEMPKYIHAPHRWILERRQIRGSNPELPDSIGYEPLWVFENDEGPVEPAWWAIERIIYAVTHPQPKKTQKDFIAEEEAELKKEKQALLEKLDDIIMSDIQSALHYDEGIVVPEMPSGTQSPAQ